MNDFGDISFNANTTAFSRVRALGSCRRLFRGGYRPFSDVRFGEVNGCYGRRAGILALPTEGPVSVRQRSFKAVRWSSFHLGRTGPSKML